MVKVIKTRVKKAVKMIKTRVDFENTLIFIRLTPLIT